MTRRAFEERTVSVPLDAIAPSRALDPEIRKTAKFLTILASVREVGLVEPLAVFPEPGPAGTQQRYMLLDGHLRHEAMMALGIATATCLVSKDDEGFTYNRQVNRLSAVQEHRMIMQAVGKGVAPERIAHALNVDISRIRERQRLLDGIAPEAVDTLKDRLVSQAVFGIIRKMKPMRQIEAAELMVSANRFKSTYARMLLAATRPEMMREAKKPKQLEATPEDIARMERQMEKLYLDYKVDEESLGETMLVLVVAKGFVARLMRNETVSTYLSRHHPDLMVEMASVMEAVASDARAPGRE